MTEDHPYKQSGSEWAGHFPKMGVRQPGKAVAFDYAEAYKRLLKTQESPLPKPTDQDILAASEKLNGQEFEVWKVVVQSDTWMSAPEVEMWLWENGLSNASTRLVGVLGHGIRQKGFPFKLRSARYGAMLKLCGYAAKGYSYPVMSGYTGMNYGAIGSYLSQIRRKYPDLHLKPIVAKDLPSI